MKYFKARHKWFAPHISEIEIDRESESSVWVNGDRKSKRTDYDNYFPTYQEAKDWLIFEVTKDICQHKSRLKEAEDLLAKYSNL